MRLGFAESGVAQKTGVATECPRIISHSRDGPLVYSFMTACHSPRGGPSGFGKAGKFSPFAENRRLPHLLENFAYEISGSCG